MFKIGLYFDIILCDKIFSSHFLTYKNYFVTTYFNTDYPIIEILMDILGEDYIKEKIIKLLDTTDLSKLDTSEKSFDHVEFYMDFVLDNLDEETLFYIKLKYSESYKHFTRKLRKM